MDLNSDIASYVQFWPVDFRTGEVFDRPLELQDVSMSASAGPGEPGTLSAKLDMRLMCGETDWDEARNVRHLCKPAWRSIVPIREYANGRREPWGEWWITKRDQSHADPVVTLTAHEFPAFFKHCVPSESFKSDDFDPVARTRELLAAEAARAGIDMNPAVNWSNLRTATEWEAGARDVATCIKDMQEAGWEWGFAYEWERVGDSDYIRRRLLTGVPEYRFESNLTIDLVSPGTTPAQGADMGLTEDVDTIAHELWASGAGAGSDQIRTVASRGNTHPMPRMSRSFSSRDATTKATLKAQAARALSTMQDMGDGTFAVEITRAHELPYIGPRVGDVIQISKEPSLSMPWAEDIPVRVIGWSRSIPKPGEDWTTTLTVERTTA